MGVCVSLNTDKHLVIHDSLSHLKNKLQHRLATETNVFYFRSQSDESTVLKPSGALNKKMVTGDD